MPTLLIAVGLVSEIFGVIVIAWPLITASRETLDAKGGTFYDGRTDSQREQDPPKDLLRERRSTRIGLGFIFAGAVLQIVALVL